ncbi:glycoside hydrolase family 15 [Tessaracoccus rhinocerotis]|uniref:Glycoside hydrolase family 15 n=1 Tax=Tessaracoccus rhinocerotis TaxID=1689449 RepID=A0A553K4M6_9ACTN|nr:glycoside hydrolase family 15 protein [Tessaracoccus rhinocerotis]TRY19622.1 glycoside hydrolase family 15 [Tessaracoccus rhinocerotis]
MVSNTADLDALLAHSRELIVSLQDEGGAYPASPTFSAYKGYCWFRDGAFIADGVSSSGEVASATAFFEWCAMVLDKHRDRIRAVVAAAAAGTPLSGDQMLPARYTFTGELGEDYWWDFQLDGYGTWLWALVEHCERHGIDVSPWRDAAELTVDYLVSSWDRPCFDWWEENSAHVHVSTLGCIAAGLSAAVDAGLVDGDRAARASETRTRIDRVLADEGTVDGHLTKWLGNPALDGSLSALVAPLRVLDADSPVAIGTLTAVERELAVDGGVHRFRADTFYGGGRWPLLTCFLGLAQLAVGDREAARRALDWAAATAGNDLMLPEQVEEHLLDESFRQEWLDRWGTVATPLLWSHAMLLRLAVEIEETR